MKHSLHHLRLLWLRFNFPVTVYAILWAFLTAAAWLVAEDGEAVLFKVAPVVLLTGGGIVLLRVLWQDPVRGTDNFWRTRPAGWRAVWLSQMMFLLLFLAGPPVLCWAVNGLMLSNTPAQWGYGAFDLLYVAGPLLALAGVASFSRGWYSFILALVAAVVCLGCGWLVMSKACFPAEHMDTHTAQWLHLLVAWASAVPLWMLITWVWGMFRPAGWWRPAATGVMLFLLPLLVWLAVPDSPPPRTVFQAALSVAGKTVPPEFQKEGVLMLRGVPEGTLALLDERQLALHPDASGIPQPLWSFPGGQVFDLHGGYAHWSGDLLESAGTLLKAVVPEETRWYTDNQRSSPASTPQLFNREPEPVTGRIEGHARGFLLSMTKLMSLPLREGAVAAESGTRLRIRSMGIEDEILDVTLDIRQSSSGQDAVPPEGYAGAGPGPAHPIPVLYFPSVPMALVISKGGDSREFRSWQTRIQQQWLRTAMPEAEAIRGIRFTPGVMKDAQLILCSLVPRGTFTVALPKDPQTLPAAPPSAMEERAAGLFLSLDYAHNYFSRSDSRPERLKKLKLMGGRAMAGILHRGAPPRDPKKFKELRPEMRLEDFVPELAAAIERDPRWMNTAWANGLGDQMGDAGLKLVRTTRQPLPVSVVAAAAAKAEPSDYPALRKHVFNAIPTSQGGSDSSGPLPGRVLWQRLRALPGFDWRSTVRERWHEAYAESHPGDKIPDELRDFAALAGDANALNGLLEAKSQSNGGGEPQLTKEEWSELAEHIEGIPPEGEAREIWLRGNRGYFTWDEGAGKYRVRTEK